MERSKRCNCRKVFLTTLLLGSVIIIVPAQGQELLKAIEPGTGYSRMKQWVIEHGMVFENFTKDSLVISGQFQEPGDSISYGVHIISKFCAGDDYSGRAYNATLQQALRVDGAAVSQIFQKQQQYTEVLAGKPSEEGRFTGDFKLRRSRMADQQGLAIGLSSPQGNWELGMFLRQPYIMIQVMRTKDELCK